MEASESPSDSINLYISEVKDIQQATTELFEEHVLLLDEVEQATDFLQKAGLGNLSKLYQQGKEIPDTIVNNSVRNRNFTEKQAQTVRSRVKTLNRTLKSRQPRRKQRQDVRDVAWNLETSSTGSRSRSATPDSLDSLPLNEEFNSDEDQQLSLPFNLENASTTVKGRLKWTSSEPIPNKVFSRHEKGEVVARLGSENVVLKGYHPLNEHSTIRSVQRDRSGSDPTAHVTNNPTETYFSGDFHSILHNENDNSTSIVIQNSSAENETLSFEECMRDHYQDVLMPKQMDCENSVSIDDLSDGQYQYLKPLLWVEVTAIFDQYKISVLKRKANNKNKKGNVFGVNLSTLVMRDMPTPTDNTMVPRVYRSVLNQLSRRCLKEDGILRMAGHKQKLEALCSEIETKFYNDRTAVDHLLTEASTHDLTGVLKKLLRELPDPVFTMELFDLFFKCSLIPNVEHKVRALNILVLMLPIEHRNTFKLLLRFFNDIIKHEQYNRMGLHNVAMITAPSFFPPRLILTKSSKDEKNNVPNRDQLAKEIKDVAVCCNIMELLLKSGDSLWAIPAELAVQARDAQGRAQSRKEGGNKKDDTKKKLQRSSTLYEAGAIRSHRPKRDFYIEV